MMDGRATGRIVRGAVAGLMLAAAGAALDETRLWAQTTPREAGAESRDLPVEDLRGRLKLLDEEHSAALADEDYDKAARVLREINRLEDELFRRHLVAPPARPPDGNAQRP